MTSKGAIQLTLLSFIWSAYYISSNYLNSRLDMFVSGAIIRAITLLILLLILGFAGQWQKLKILKASLLRLLLIGVLCFVLDGTAFIGFMHCSSGEGTALLKADIIFILIMTAISDHKLPSLKNALLSLFMLLGIFVLVDTEASGGYFTGVYSWFFIASAFAASCNAFLVKGTQKRFPQITDMAIAVYNLLFSGICFLIISICGGALSAGISGFTREFDLIAASIISGSFDAVLFIIYYRSLRVFSVWLVKIFLLTMPAISSLISLVLFGEALTLRELAGIIIICVGALLIMESERKKEALLTDKPHNGPAVL